MPIWVSMWSRSGWRFGGAASGVEYAPWWFSNKPTRRYKASQAVFAAYLNTSPSTVQKREQFQKKPNGPSLKLLNLVDKKGLEALA